MLSVKTDEQPPRGADGNELLDRDTEYYDDKQHFSKCMQRSYDWIAVGPWRGERRRYHPLPAQIFNLLQQSDVQHFPLATLVAAGWEAPGRNMVSAWEDQR